ncbi:hypothetical protein C7B69_00045 [filamentous cyanobacterium Phorm 46]|nr:hypothetical protein C7B69_00045 [filamentous cyanobacterium Phorm 46]PSB45000.1 hypothetical protein C7B67_21920 [filamentous cyanobacterium Phorm 6]
MSKETAGAPQRVQRRSIPAEDLLVRIRDLLPEYFAPMNIFALIEMHPISFLLTLPAKTATGILKTFQP